MGCRIGAPAFVERVCGRQDRPNQTTDLAPAVPAATQLQLSKENIVTAIYTFDVLATLDGFGSYGEGGDWGGYWGKQGPEFLDRRLAWYGEQPRLVLGATTYRQFLEILGPSIEESEVRDPV